MSMARKTEMRNAANVNHKYGNEYLDNGRVAYVYFTSGADSKARVKSLKEHNKISLNQIRRANDYDDGIFNVSQHSEHEFDELESIDSQQIMNGAFF